MQNIHLRPVDPVRDFKLLAEWFTILDGQENTVESLTEWYAESRDRSLQMVVEDSRRRLLGFYWAVRDLVDPARFNLYLYVEPGQRNQGLGSQIYEELIAALHGLNGNTVRVRIVDNDPGSLKFAERRGFHQRAHQIAMELNLQGFDDKPYEPIIDRLQTEGFRFTSMEALGNTQELQHKLYLLNDMTNSETPGSGGEHAWVSFEDFQLRVCQANWYNPAGQMLVIDDSTAEFVALSAITIFEGNDFAYNLHTGVDKRYRGRKLGQAVKVHALRFARDVLKAPTVRTHHNQLNEPIIAIDRKFGYVQIPGYYSMEKEIQKG